MPQDCQASRESHDLMHDTHCRHHRNLKFKVFMESLASLEDWIKRHLTLYNFSQVDHTCTYE